jgi:hypothetical protein
MARRTEKRFGPKKESAVIKLTPADGMMAATGKRDFGTSRWRLSEEATPFPPCGEAGS